MLWIVDKLDKKREISQNKASLELFFVRKNEELLEMERESEKRLNKDWEIKELLFKKQKEEILGKAKKVIEERIRFKEEKNEIKKKIREKDFEELEKKKCETEENLMVVGKSKFNEDIVEDVVESRRIQNFEHKVEFKEEKQIETLDAQLLKLENFEDENKEEFVVENLEIIHSYKEVEGNGYSKSNEVDVMVRVLGVVMKRMIMDFRTLSFFSKNYNFIFV